MSEQSSYEKLGVTEDASFEQIQEARKRMIEQYQGDQKVLQTIEAAYDAILMDRLKMRQEGKIKVPEPIRFPERISQVAPPSFSATPVKSSPAWLQRFIDTPSLADVLWPTGLFLTLSLIVVFFPGDSGSKLSMAIALGVAINVFLINRKERQLGRSMLLTLAGLFLGIGLGTLLWGWLQVPISQTGLKAEQFYTLVTFFLMWISSSFLR